MSEAVYIVEYRSISRGVVNLDRMLKRAVLEVMYAAPICIGKYLIVVGGDVGEVREAADEAERDKGDKFIASHLLTGAHPGILDYFRHEKAPVKNTPDSIGLFEVRNAASGFFSLDSALKSGNISLLHLWLGQFIGGKLCYVLGGTVSDVEAALRSAKNSIKAEELVGSELIPRPDAAAMSLFISNGMGGGYGGHLRTDI
jgi:microcompartment protein CcmL/EutN